MDAALIALGLGIASAGSAWRARSKGDRGWMGFFIAMALISAALSIEGFGGV